MKVEVDVSFYLWEGSSLLISESLEITIKFKDPTKKFFQKQKIKRRVIEARDFAFQEDYHEKVRKYLNDEDEIMRDITTIVKKYFKEKRIKDTSDAVFNELFNISVKKKIRTTVEVDE